MSVSDVVVDTCGFTAPIDVLEVLGGIAVDFHAGAVLDGIGPDFDAEGALGFSRDLRHCRAAVAQLIEASIALLAAFDADPRFKRLSPIACNRMTRALTRVGVES